MAAQAMMNSSASVYSMPALKPGARTDSDWGIHRLVVQSRDYAWSEKVMGKLDELVKLPTGWDGYAGRGVDFNIAYFAANLLQAIYVPDAASPSLVPGSDGSLQIEWHSNGLDIELDVLGVNQVRCLMSEVGTENEEEATLTVDFKIVREWVKELARRADNAVPAAA
ncbi:MAG: hypothetical protein E5V25_11515 [Mesorhizobium sp.]|nr:MAG: hypothetical protein E5V25_11515 [Mesorhizobium sp.]